MRKYEYRQATLCPRWISKIFGTVNVLCRINAKELTCLAMKTCNHEIFGLIMAQEGIN